MPSSKPALDPATTVRLRQLLSSQQPQMLTELLDFFIETTPSLIEGMHLGLQRGDSEVLYQALHTLKPCSAYLGANQVTSQCELLEHKVKSGQLANAVSKLATLEIEFNRAKQALAELLVQPTGNK